MHEQTWVTATTKYIWTTHCQYWRLKLSIPMTRSSELKGWGSTCIRKALCPYKHCVIVYNEIPPLFTHFLNASSAPPVRPLASIPLVAGAELLVVRESNMSTRRPSPPPTGATGWVGVPSPSRSIVPPDVPCNTTSTIYNTHNHYIYR